VGILNEFVPNTGLLTTQWSLQQLSALQLPTVVQHTICLFTASWNHFICLSNNLITIIFYINDGFVACIVTLLLDVTWMYEVTCESVRERNTQWQSVLFSWLFEALCCTVLVLTTTANRSDSHENLASHPKDMMRYVITGFSRPVLSKTHAGGGRAVQDITWGHPDNS
jgi:hypothetical protein